MANLDFVTRLRQFRQDAADRQLERDIYTILSAIKRFPKILNYEINGRIITGELRSEGNIHRFTLDYSGAKPQFIVDPPKKS